MKHIVMLAFLVFTILMTTLLTIIYHDELREFMKENGITKEAE